MDSELHCGTCTKLTMLAGILSFNSDQNSSYWCILNNTWSYVRFNIWSFSLVTKSPPWTDTKCITFTNLINEITNELLISHFSKRMPFYIPSYNDKRVIYSWFTRGFVGAISCVFINPWRCAVCISLLENHGARLKKYHFLNCQNIFIPETLCSTARTTRETRAGDSSYGHLLAPWHAPWSWVARAKSNSCTCVVIRVNRKW